MKKIIALMLVILLAISVVGCKSKGYSDDEEIAFVAGDETQVDINKTEDTETQEQSTENKEQIKETANEEQSETTDKNVETSSELNSDKLSEDTSKDAVDEQPSVEKTEDVTSKQDTTTEKKVNQVALERQPHEEDYSIPPLVLYSTEDLVKALKTYEFTVNEEERQKLEKHYSTITDEQTKIDRISKIGTKDDIRFKIFNTDNIEYFYKLKNDEIPGFKLVGIPLNSKYIAYNYEPESDSFYSKETYILVTYRRPDNFVTDSYFNDFMEYYDIKNWKSTKTNLAENGLIYGDDFLYIKYKNSNSASIMFPVENTVVEIMGVGDMANYDALKKLCVAEKVVVK